MKFELRSPYKPTGDQPDAIKGLLNGISRGSKKQILLGVTGSGKTFTIANVINKLNKPTLVISHNKTLAAQLYGEFCEFFPRNAVEYFVSYYDYYQPEAYIPQTDVYIEKDASINEELDKLRLKATSSLMMRKDVIIVASVSCIYNLGSPDEYKESVFSIKNETVISRRDILEVFVRMQYERNDINLRRGYFSVKGSIIEIIPSYEDDIIRIQFDDHKIVKIEKLNILTRKKVAVLKDFIIYPAKHFVANKDAIERSLIFIKRELKKAVEEFKKEGKILEAQRLESRTKYDMEMLREIGYCHGIENYSRHLSRRSSGARPFCLLDYFPKDFLTVIDESHVTLPQLRGMYHGDRSRKETLVKFGFRLPSCLDNRPLKFEEFQKLVSDVIFVSATPAEYEIKESNNCVVEQLIRPTGLLEPSIVVKSTKGQIEDLIVQIKFRVEKKERVLVTTLTKRMAEDLSAYLKDLGVEVRYLHSEINPIERVKILSDLRSKKFDCLVGINLLREGLDLPEVSLIAILDADKEGFLRSESSLIQVSGRAARHINGEVIMYADNVTNSMQKAIEEMSRRREVQMLYNKKHNIKPSSIKKAIKDYIETSKDAQSLASKVTDNDKDYEFQALLQELYNEMELYARNLQFEKAASTRDLIKELKENKDATLEDIISVDKSSSRRRKYARRTKS